MREILVINPRKKSKKRKKVTTMPGKKRRRRRAAPKRRRIRRNPRKSRGKAIARRVGGRMFSGLSLKKSMQNMLWSQIGMFAAKWGAKRFGENASETDPSTWNYLSYLKGGAGAVLGAMLCNAMKPGTGQKVLDGGVALMFYKMLQNEVIAKNEWAVSQFGADDDYVPDEYLMTGDENWFLGEDGQYYPTDERYRLPEAAMGDSMRPVDALGDALVPVTELGAADTKEQYRRAYFQSM